MRHNRIPSTALKLLALCSALACIGAGHGFAQQIDTIKPNPNAVQLRKIWEVRGTKEGENAGLGFGAFGDIYGTGTSAWGVKHGDPYAWRIYTWDPVGDSAQFRQAIFGYATQPVSPIIGNFRGDGHPLVGLPIGSRIIYLFETSNHRIDTPWVIAVDPLAQTPPASNIMQDAKVLDLDGDRADELVVFSIPFSRHPEVWIYRGGPGFRGDTPTVVLHDSETNGGAGREYLYVGRLDNDEYPDLMTGCDYADGTQKLKIWFGRPGSPWNWTTPDREVVFGDPFALDCDGDGILDVAIPTTPFLKPGTPTSIALFLSSSGKSMRDRPLDSNDIDLLLVNSTYTYPRSAGFLNDSARRFEMLRLVTVPTLLMGGGPNGPDRYFDAYGSLVPPATGTPDLDGDGWPDVMTASPLDDFERGYCQIFAGGPYIPSDPLLDVHWVSNGAIDKAIALWPNPARDQVHIAWRGDLARLPRRFEVYDATGRLIARGQTESWRGEVLWNCAGAASGLYLVRVLDFHGLPIADATVHVRH